MSGLRKIIEEKKVEFVGFGNQTLWELIKFEIRKFTMEYSKKVTIEIRRVLELNEKITMDLKLNLEMSI